MFEGSLVALITPFRHGELDWEGVQRCVDAHLAGGTQALVVAGTTGEAPVLHKSEYRQLLEAVCQQVAGRLPVIAGASSCNPVEALTLAALAQESGVDGLMCAAGYYNRPDQEGLYQHFRFLHDRTRLPLLIYNVPPRTVVDVVPDTLARLAQLERVVGVKDASADLMRPMLEWQQIRRPFSWLSGDDGTAVAYNAMGGNGVISVLANVLPAMSRQLQDACRLNDFATARRYQRTLLPLIQALALSPSPAGIKYACSLAGLCTEECRAPMMPVTAPVRERIATALLPLLEGGVRQAG
ncbi:MAG: 4-hydroxy-tetrahydrodipicolinate synthase [Pseudomonadota bacterium]|nr:4-hydroxy-tetrahydrodipicolinate synthase [Pseudomonadota bacterium]